MLKLFRKKIVSTFRGSDVYDIEKSVKEEGENSPYHKLYKQKNQKYFSNVRSRKKFIVKNSDKVILIGPWIAKSVGVFDQIIPYSRDIDSIRKIKNKTKKRQELTIVHAPTNKEVKGTKYVIRAVSNLKKEGFKINLLLTDKMPRKKLMQEISSCDLVIDQLLIGWYGGFAVEAMALGKPVICYLKEEYLKQVSFGMEIPVINTDRVNLEKVLKNLLKDKSELQDIGKRSYLFVKKVHDSSVIAEKYKKVYESLT